MMSATYLRERPERILRGLLVYHDDSRLIASLHIRIYLLLSTCHTIKMGAALPLCCSAEKIGFCYIFLVSPVLAGLLGIRPIDESANIAHDGAHFGLKSAAFRSLSHGSLDVACQEQTLIAYRERGKLRIYTRDSCTNGMTMAGETSLSSVQVCATRTSLFKRHGTIIGSP